MRKPKSEFDESKIRNFVPFYMRDLVCMCVPNDMYGTSFYEDERHIGGVGNLSIRRCKKCDKYMRFMQRICTLCGDRFVLTFQHPKYWPGYPTCWHCTLSDDYDPWESRDSIWYSPIVTTERIKEMRAKDKQRRYETCPIIEPLPSDLVKKEQVTELSIEPIDLAFDDEVIF